MAGQLLKIKQARSIGRRKAILKAATKLFGERGIHRTSLTAIAKTAKVPLSSLYDYFPDKQALVLEVPAENFTLLSERTVPLLSAAASPAEQLRTVYLTNFQYIKDNPGWGRVFFLEIWPSVTAASPKVRTAVDRYAKRYVDLVKQAIKRGEYRKSLDPYVAMSLLMGGMCHLTAVWLLYGKKFDLVAKGEELYRTLDAGFARLRPPSSRP